MMQAKRQAGRATDLSAAAQEFSINKPLFISPPPAGRKITAGFTFLQRIGRAANIDVWFPEILKQELDALIKSGAKLGPENFPAEWAAVRQFELLQEAGNYKIYDLKVTDLNRTLLDLARNMRAGGYRVTVATLGSYVDGTDADELEILDRRLQDRIARMIHMLYLEEQSEEINAAMDKKLAAEQWDYQSVLPHVGMTLGAGDLFRAPVPNAKQIAAVHKQKLAQHFFDILSLLPQRHVVHDTAIGLQLPESIAEQEQTYIAAGDETLLALNQVLNDLFRPHDKISLGKLHEREGAGAEIKSTVQHLRGYGDRLTPDADNFYRRMAQYSLQ
ncbi:MAG: hypothetical protein SFW62_03255 [Alphaproteobacteria bacterium]|nr:hypothetical protein [Alphaproteobacteria bacterium]